MKFIELYRSIMQGVWNIGFVENTLDGVIDGEPLKIRWLEHECKDRWFADPFILDVTDDKIYVLVEEYYYPHKRGRLAMLTVDKASNKLLKVDTILELDSHLSFPAIIRRDGKILVYPENFKGGGLKLYDLDLEKPALVNARPISDALLTDAIYTELFGKKQIYSTEIPDPNGSTLGVYETDGAGKYVKVKEYHFPEKIARNAGDWFEYKGKKYRPAQESNTEYGHGISFQQIEETPDGLVFKELWRKSSPHPTMKVAFHTFNMYKGVMVVDCRGYRYKVAAGIINFFKRLFVKE